MNDTRKLDSDDVLDYIGPMDPDMALTVDYLSGQATPEQIAEFERRFVEDEAFYMNVAPAIKVWNMPVSFRELMKRPPADLTAQRHARDLRNAAATTERTSAVEPAPAAEAARGAPPSAVPAPRRSSVKRRRYRRAVNAINFGLKAVVAASLLLIAGIQAYISFSMNRPDDVKVVQQALENQQDAAAAAKASRPAAATVVPSIPKPRGSVAMPAPGASRLTPPHKVATPPDTMADTSRTEAEVIRSGIVALGNEVRTGDRETKVVELKNGTRVALRPNTAIRQMRGLPIGPGAEYIYVEGEIAVDVPPVQSGLFNAVMIMSPAGNLMAQGPGILSAPGESKISTSFAVRCRPPNCTALEVAVAEGSVRIFRGVEVTKGVQVGKGQFGLASGTELPTLVDSARAVGFPKPDPSIRKQP